MPAAWCPSRLWRCRASIPAPIVTAADPEDAVTALFTDEADLAAGWSSLAGDAAAGYSFGVFTRMVSAGALSMDRLRIVWQSPLIPFGPHVLRRDMPAELKALIADALMAMANEAPDALDAVDRSSIGGGGFVPAAAKDYAVIEELVADRKRWLTPAHLYCGGRLMSSLRRGLR